MAAAAGRARLPSEVPAGSSLPALLPSGPAADPPPPDRIEAFLTELVADLEPEATGPPGRGRPRILPALALWGGLVVCVLRGWSDQKALWRLLVGTGLRHFTPFPISDAAVYKRLAAAEPSPVARVFTDLTALLVDRLPPHADRTLAPFAPEVFALDQTTLDPVARRRRRPPARQIGRGLRRAAPTLAGDRVLARSPPEREAGLP